MTAADPNPPAAPEGKCAARTAAFLIIGNEILSGRTKDVNLNHLACRLREKGVSLREARVVRDETAAIISAVRELSAACDLVFTSGGIGPTHDDITTACVAEAFGVEAKIDPSARKILESYYVPRGEELTPARLKMATIPEGAELIANKVTGAPAYRIGNVHVLAGVPRIFVSMLDEIIEAMDPAEGYSSRTVRVWDGESTIAVLLERVQESHPDLDVGSYPKMSDQGFHCELVVSGLGAAKVDAAFSDLLVALKEKGTSHEEIKPAPAAD